MCDVAELTLLLIGSYRPKNIQDVWMVLKLPAFDRQFPAKSLPKTDTVMASIIVGRPAADLAVANVAFARATLLVRHCGLVLRLRVGKENARGAGIPVGIDHWF